MENNALETPNEAALTPLFRIGPGNCFPVYACLQPDFAFSKIRDPICYLIDGEGWMIVKRSPLADAFIRLEKGIEAVDKYKSTIRLNSGKIPLELFRKVEAFFKAIYKRDKTEAAVYLYYSPSERKWDFYVPPQKATSSAVKYDKPDDRLDGFYVAGTIHSHAGMSAFHSGTDTHDETNFDGVHITMGNFDKSLRDYSSSNDFAVSVMIQGARAKYELSDVVDGLDVEDEEVPEMWLNRVEKESYSTSGNSMTGTPPTGGWNKYPSHSTSFPYSSSAAPTGTEEKKNPGANGNGNDGKNGSSDGSSSDSGKADNSDGRGLVLVTDYLSIRRHGYFSD